MKLLAIIMSYLVALLLGAYIESFFRIAPQPFNEKSLYQLALELPKNERELQKRIFINIVEKQCLEEIQKRKFFPSPKTEKD